MPRKTKRSAYIAGYEQAIKDLMDRNAVSWKYTDFAAIAEMIKVAGETQYELWEAEDEQVLPNS